MSELYYVLGWILGKMQLFFFFFFLQTTWFSLKSTDCCRLAWQQQADNSLSSIINLYRLGFQDKKQFCNTALNSRSNNHLPTL